jgi:hypothetical protein
MGSILIILPTLILRIALQVRKHRLNTDGGLAVDPAALQLSLFL